MLRNISWFYVAFVVVNFMVMLWYLISGYLTISTGLPLPYFMLYIPSNLMAAGIISYIMTLTLYAYLGIALIKSWFLRGMIPISFSAALVGELLSFLLGQYIIAEMFLIVIMITEIGTYITLASIAANKVSRILWSIDAVISIIMTIISNVMYAYVSYLSSISISLAILACTMDFWMYTRY